VFGVLGRVRSRVSAQEKSLVVLIMIMIVIFEYLLVNEVFEAKCAPAPVDDFFAKLKVRRVCFLRTDKKRGTYVHINLFFSSHETKMT